MNKKIIKISAIVLVAVIVLLAVLKSSGIIGDSDSIQVTAGKATKSDIIETVSANGKIQPEVEVKISADVSGEVVELHVKEGNVVKKGTLLVRINPEIYVSNMDRMTAAVNSSKANLENAKSRLTQAQSQFLKTELNYQRNKKLFDEKVISASDFESVKSDYEVGKAEVEASLQSVRAAEFGVSSSVASLNEAKENLNKTSIYAPVNGTISKLSVEKGERVVGTSQMAGTEIMRIANLNEMEVNVDVSENDIVRVHFNDTALIEVDAYRDKKFKGIVTEIANSANLVGGQSTDQVTNFSVKIRILRESYQELIPENKPDASPFLPGMSATVDIQTKRADQVITVPIQAVTTRDTTLKESSKTMRRNTDAEEEKDSPSAQKASSEKVTECVFLITNGKVKIQVVETGIQDNKNIEIKSGIRLDDQVVTGPFSVISKKLKEGDKIKIVSDEKLFVKN